MSTDSYDALGAVDGEARWEHVTPELIERVLDRFRGEILQTPPVCVRPVDLCVARVPARTTR